MNDWQKSEERPGYVVKTVIAAGATVRIFRPLLDARERARREDHVRDVLGMMPGPLQRDPTGEGVRV